MVTASGMKGLEEITVMNDKPMTAVVEFQVNTETTTVEEWLEEWSKRAEDAQVGEPQTPSYAAAINSEVGNNILVFERYSHGDGSLKEHMSRAAHDELHERMGEKNMTKRRVLSTRFVDVEDYGWWSRPEQQEVMMSPGLILTILGMRFPNLKQLEKFIELSRFHSDYCWTEEPGTLVYSGGLALSDADREVDIKAGDLIFVMASTDMAAMVKHRDDPKHLALGEQFVEKGISVEGTFLRTYETTGDGYLWK